MCVRARAPRGCSRPTPLVVYSLPSHPPLTLFRALQWENQRLDLEEEDLLQRTKDLQLLRVTKSLQGIIKGG